jgi:hypothetical protein
MRNKLRLEIDDLKVASFSTGDAGERRGTVKAHETWDYNCPPPSASEPNACVCQSDEPTYDTTCNPNQCYCMGSFVICTRRDR